MGIIKKIKWQIIKALLSDLEKVILYDSCNLAVKQMRTEFNNGKWYDYPLEEEQVVRQLMDSIQGKQNFAKWS